MPLQLLLLIVVVVVVSAVCHGSFAVKVGGSGGKVATTHFVAAAAPFRTDGVAAKRKPIRARHRFV